MGVAHLSCNLRRRETQGRVPIYAHNMTGFDGHLILNAIAGLLDSECVDIKSLKLEGISSNTERLRSIRFRDFIFLDSLSFLDGSLERVAKELKRGNHSFPILWSSGVIKTKEQFDLMSSKGIFPYSRLRDLDEFDEMKELPPIEDFYNDLSGRPCDPDDYARAKRVFDVFECHSMSVCFNYN